MELIKFEEYIKKYNHKIVATIGSFDGIHLGHQELIKITVDKAKELKIYSAVITFDPHPLNVNFISFAFFAIAKFKITSNN